MAWKPDEKETFLYRAGIPHKARFGTELSKFLRQKGIIKSGDRLKVSILDRLLNSEAAKNRVGLTFKGRKVALVADEQRVLKALSRIIEDARNGSVNLNKAWSNDSKYAYFSHLETEGFLPVVANDVRSAASQYSKSADKKNDVDGKVKKDKPYVRPLLIPADVKFPTDTLQNAARIRNIVAELQGDLYFSKHMNAIAVLFRVLVELCIDHYIDAEKIEVDTKKRFASMAEKFESCLARMVENRFLSERDRRVLAKYAQLDQFFSLDTFHAYVHHRLAHPTQSDLIAMWDQLQPFVLQCLSSRDKQRQVA